MRKVILFCCSLFSTAASAEPDVQSILPDFFGIWSGSGSQDNGSRWSIAISLQSDHYAIDYPSLKCGGTLELLEENVLYNRLTFKENLSYGLEECYNHGRTVLVKNSDHEISYQWFFQNGRRAAIGRLIRTVIFNSPVRFKYSLNSKKANGSQSH